MVIHIFKANISHHVPLMIESILKNANHTNTLGVEDHFFLLRYSKNLNAKDLNDEINLSIYKNLFNKYNTNNYKIITDSIAFIASLLKLTKKDQLIIHDNQSLFGRVQIFWFFLFLMGTEFRNRTSIVLWGVSEVKKKSKNFIYDQLYNIHGKVLRSLKYVIALTADDEIKIKKWYNLSNVFVTNYILDLFNEFKEFNNYSKKHDGITRIIISHSSFSHNYQLEIFDMLARFKDKNILIICPLSYGDSYYRQIVIDKGKQIFADKFQYFDKIMPRNEYNELLASTDIFISNAIIQTGLYITNFCLCTGKKTYLRENNFNWSSHLGFKINNVSELKDISFSDLIDPINGEWELHNKRLASQIFSAEHTVEDWKSIYY